MDVIDLTQDDPKPMMNEVIDLTQDDPKPVTCEVIDLTRYDADASQEQDQSAPRVSSEPAEGLGICFFCGNGLSNPKHISSYRAFRFAVCDCEMRIALVSTKNVHSVYYSTPPLQTSLASIDPRYSPLLARCVQACSGCTFDGALPELDVERLMCMHHRQCSLQSLRTIQLRSSEEAGATSPTSSCEESAMNDNIDDEANAPEQNWVGLESEIDDFEGSSNEPKDELEDCDLPGLPILKRAVFRLRGADISDATNVGMKRKRNDDIDGHVSCRICLEPIIRSNGLADDPKALRCGHEFHSSCIRSWLLKALSCPVCRCEPFQQDVQEAVKSERERYRNNIEEFRSLWEQEQDIENKWENGYKRLESLEQQQDDLEVQLEEANKWLESLKQRQHDLDTDFKDYRNWEDSQNDALRGIWKRRRTLIGPDDDVDF
ncbi:hypothetical protein NA57DRAFT_52762 [Rhizodiscina lignyota]|uniref:RING-type E3 ubiquitin transferase n=1 Tax=Rhizodiscina lignyota TaxID=1504668 RepID=A0A9P4IKH7_9PEZI|nr:hypothetical protein NA57DRAFT_52762 [Rhizodiscina lignyota]